MGEMVRNEVRWWCNRCWLASSSPMVVAACSSADWIVTAVVAAAAVAVAGDDEDDAVGEHHSCHCLLASWGRHRRRWPWVVWWTHPWRSESKQAKFKRQKWVNARFLYISVTESKKEKSCLVVRFQGELRSPWIRRSWIGPGCDHLRS